MGGRYTRGPFDPFEQRPFEGFREIRIPRPPRRFWIGLGFVVAALLVVFLTAPIVGFVTENQWYQALALGSVYLTRVGLPALLFLVSLVLLYVWRGDTMDLRLTAPALGHLSVLLAVFALVIAGGTILDRFDLVFSHNGVVYGAGYTDVHVRTGLALAQAIFGVLLGALLIANVFLRQGRIMVGAAAAWILGSIFVAAYPAFVQRVTVVPAELTQESPYIQREIQFTRQAYGVGNVQVQSFGGAQPVTPQALAADQATINNLRLWDNTQIQQTYQQLQSIRTYYTFGQIDLDRYNVNGSTQQVEISARGVDQSKL